MSMSVWFSTCWTVMLSLSITAKSVAHKLRNVQEKRSSCGAFGLAVEKVQEKLLPCCIHRRTFLWSFLQGTMTDFLNQHQFETSSFDQHCTSEDSQTQHNTTQHNTTQHNTTQHNTTQHNTTQHNHPLASICSILHKSWESSTAVCFLRRGCRREFALRARWDRLPKEIHSTSTQIVLHIPSPIQNCPGRGVGSTHHTGDSQVALDSSSWKTKTLLKN